MALETIKEIRETYTHFTMLSDTLIHLYNTTCCEGCGLEVMASKNEYLEMSETSAGGLVSLLRFHKMKELEDTPEELDWLEDIQMSGCSSCQETDSVLTTT